MNLWSKPIDWLSQRVGGQQRLRVIFLLAMALGLDGADLGTVGALSPILQHHFSISNSEIGLLIGVSKGVGVFSVLFFGSIVDRARRTSLLAIAIALWAMAIIACGAAFSYSFLLFTRLALGIVAAATLPCTASLIGDYFPGQEWGKIYGYILSGEMIGTGFGFILSGELGIIWWRLGFWVLAIPSIPLAWWIYKLPEPRRGAQDVQYLQGKTEQESDDRAEPLLARKAGKARVQPRRRLVRKDDPAKNSIWWAIGYVLSIPTNAALIISSALGYAFFSDVRTFGIDYAQTGYHLQHSFAVSLLAVVGIGALAGVWTGGRLSDNLLAKGYLKARVWLATAFFCASVLFFFLGFFFQILWLSLVFFACSSFSLGALNPPLDSARLDIIHPRLWGRAESVRMIFRDASEAAAPVAFGWLVENFGGHAIGLRDGFLIMLIPLGMAAAISLITFRTYPSDAAAAAAYRKNTMNRLGASG